MDGDEDIEIPFDLSEWTVVDEDVCEDDNKALETEKHTDVGSSKIKHTSTITGVDKTITSQTQNKSMEISSTTSAKNPDLKAASSKTSLASRNVAKSTGSVSSGDTVKNAAKSTTSNNSTSNAVQNVAKSAPSSNMSNAAKNGAKSAVSSSTSDPVKSVTKPSHETSNKLPSENKAVAAESSAHIGNKSANTPSTRTVTSTSQMKKSVGVDLVSEISSLFSLGTEKLPVKTPMVAQKVSSAAEKNSLSKSSDAQKSEINAVSVPAACNTSSKESTAKIVTSSESAENKNINTMVKSTPSSVASSITSSEKTAGPVVTSASKSLSSTVNNMGQLGLKAASSQAQMKSKTQVKPRTGDVGSIAEIMESVSKIEKVAKGTSYPCDTEDISDTEFSETMDIATCLVPKVGTAKVAGVKREASPNKEGPVIKKTKLQNSTATGAITQVGHDQLASPVVKQQAKQSDQIEETGVKKSPQQQSQGGRTEENLVKKPVKKQYPGSNSSTPKGSFGAVKTPAMKSKSQPAVTPPPAKMNTVIAAAKTNEVVNKAEISAVSTPTTMPVKRIIRRFHRMTQTVPKVCSNKLLQCLIQIPSLDTPRRLKSDAAVQTVSKKTRDEVFYQKPLPDTVRPTVFKVVSSFDVNHPGNRNIIIGSFDYGISLGHVTAADVEKSMFRENLLTKSTQYNLYFDREDYGVVDLLFAEEEQFVSVLTHIRKMKIGPRHLVVTYCKNLKEKERAPGSQVSCVKATIIYNQNFASTNFLTYSKAPLWNKPKVEQTLSIHNLPGGIPVDFLKLIIPDAITIELDDKKKKFTQEGSRVHLGLNHKNGGDRFMKLFAQMYINNECLAFSLSGTSISDVPELSDILREKEKRKKETKSEIPLREINAVPRDIGGISNVAAKNQAEVIMHIDTVDAVEKILSGRTSAWTGPSSVEKLQQALLPKGQPESSTSKSVKKKSKDTALSDVSDDLSNISDTSDIGEEIGIQEKSQKKKNALSADEKLTAMPSGASRHRGKMSTLQQSQNVRQKCFTALLADASRSNKRFQRQALYDKRGRKLYRFEDIRYNGKPIRQPLGRSTQSGRQERAKDVDREQDDRVRRSISSSDRGRKFAQRKNVTEARVRDESESSRDRIQRKRLQTDEAGRAKYEKLNTNQRAPGRNADDRSRRGQSGSRSERGRYSEERDDRQVRVKPKINRHGERVINLRERKAQEMQDSFFQDRQADKARHNNMERIDMYNDQDSRRGERLNLLVQKRLGSLERQERESTDRRERQETRSRSPSARLTHRGRSASPRRQQSVSNTSDRARRFSPTPPFRNQRTFAGIRRSRSPPQQSRSSALSPISVGEDTLNAPEGMWLSQPPSTHNASKPSEKSHSQFQTAAGLPYREDMQRGSSRPSSNLVAVKAEWKSAGVSHESEREQLEANDSRRILERFVERMIEAGKKTASGSKVPNRNRSPSPLATGAKLFENIRDVYHGGVNFTDTGSGIGTRKILNSVAAVPSGTQDEPRADRSYSGSRGGPASSGTTRRPLPRRSESPIRGRGSGELTGHFDSRRKHDVNTGGSGDLQRNDVPAGNKRQMFGRESGIPNQPGSGGYRESGISNQSGSGGYRESGISSQPGSGGYRESGISSQPGSGGYKESGIPNQPGSGGYRESGIPTQPGSGGYRESGIPNQPGPGGYRESGIPPQPGSGGYRESGIPTHLGSGGYRQNQNAPIPPPIPPPVAPPLFNSMPGSSQERISHLEALAHMLAANIEKQQTQVPPNAAQGMWGVPPQLPGPPPHSGGPPPMIFPGPQPPQGQNINFSGPPHVIRPSSIRPPHDVRGLNPPSSSWPHSNFF